ncbi:unnamed protein product [Cuscuta europaea]|uniref:SWIM-type domain-containing protein n=1 Tax=Cuscuta europaea TaxID=41803 RepID=A0A9P1ED34_CUSEU|nr:unnamed protein product [Cuscuta europaea]
MIFWKAKKAYNEADFVEALDEMGKVSPAAVTAFKAYNPKCFWRTYIRTTTKCDVIVSNMTETFNGYIINARAKHIIFMLQDIRGALMQTMVVKRQGMENNGSLLCPRIQARLEKSKDEAANCTFLPSSEVLFQVCHRLGTLTVNFEAKSCTCRKWDPSRVSCCHVVACNLL